MPITGVPVASEKMEIFPLELSGHSESSKSLGLTPKFHSYMSCQRSFPQLGRHRTRSASISAGDRPTKSFSTSFSTAILFRDENGDPVLQPLVSSTDTMDDDILNFFKCYKCYDLIPVSAKLVMLDSKLIVKKAFCAMVDEGVRACPLWDSGQQQYVGMLTITDFIRVLKNNYKGKDVVMAAFEEQRLCDVKGVSKEDPSDLFHMYPDSSLFDAASQLLNKKIHRLPIIDSMNGNVIYIMTQKPIIKFLFGYFPNLAKATVLQQTIRDADIGTYQNIKVAKKTTKILEALSIFVEDQISALPIVDDDGKLIHIYSKFDVINLAAEGTYYNLDVTLEEANEHRTEWFQGVHSCKADETVYAVMERLVNTDVARLVVVDNENKVVGIITVSDILWYLLNRPNKFQELGGRRIRRNTYCRREDSIGEEFEELDEFSADDVSDKSLKNNSCSPPSWFNV